MIILPSALAVIYNCVAYPENRSREFSNPCQSACVLVEAHFAGETVTSEMTSNLDREERTPALLELLRDLDSVIATIPHDFSSVTTPLRSFRAILEQFQQAQAIHRLQPDDLGEQLVDRMYEFCTTLKNDIERVWPSGSPDWKSFKSANRGISEMASFLTPQAASFGAAIYVK